MASFSSISLSPSPSPIIPSIIKPKPHHFYKFLKSCSTVHLSSNTPLAAKPIHFQNPHGISQKRSKIWRTNATSTESLPPESAPVETAQDLVSSTGSDGSASVISVLFFVAFLALSILTIGVIYIAVTDFLQKREADKFEKEEASKKKKKSGRKVKTRARAGPRGFGQKADEYDNDDD